MPSTKQILKAGGRGALSTTLVATKCAKYGLSFTSGLVKTLFGGVENLANQFAPGLRFGIGKYLYESGEKLVTKGFDKLIAAQASLKKRLR